MKHSINLYQFRDAFNSIRPNNFTYEGLEVLFNWLEELGEDTGEEVELDVIALCCEFTEDSIENVLDNYSLDNVEELYDNTIVIEVDSDNIIYMNY